MDDGAPTIQARFDDLRSGAERSFRLVGPVGVIEARRPEEVAPALGALEATAAEGLWAAGFVSYEAAPALDPDLEVRSRPADDPFADLPLLWFATFEACQDDFLDEDARPTASTGPWRPSVDRAAYDAAIERIREHIAAGDTHQVNHTLRLRSRFDGDERDLYRDLCLAQRGGCAAYLNAGRYRVLSASPELFFRIDGDHITTRPMKGTAPRGRWTAEDDAAAARLVASAKERAENAMIVDLLRNDLGRISEPGSVRVERLFETERYETVWQLTSTVSSRLRPGTSLVEVFRALFPSGSVTGAPKVATMRIIVGLEDSPRGVYCGAVGYLAPPGSDEPRARFNVAIRTVVLDRQTHTAEYGVGGGITHDSQAAREYDEVLTKARVLTVRRPAFGLFETLRYEPAAGFLHLVEHLDRLGGSARYFGFRFDRNEALGALKKAAAGAGGQARVRLTLARDGTLRAETSPLPAAPEDPVRVAFDDEPVDPTNPWLFHKTTLREPYEGRRRRRPDVDDVLLVNDRGEVTESTIANLAVRLDATWWTPPLDAGLLAGTYRAVLLREGKLRERPIRIEELRSAEEIALVNSVRGWHRVVMVL
jgi:para-aminobenzoate synthetase/4-amino-4-deoxychorismate lyase